MRPGSATKSTLVQGGLLGRRRRIPRWRSGSRRPTIASGARIRLVLNAGNFVHDVEGPLKRGGRLLHDGVEIAERADRLGREDQRADEAGEIADRRAAGHNALADQHQHRRDREAAAGFEQGVEPPTRIGGLHLEAANLVEGARRLALEIALEPVSLGDARAREALGDEARHLAGLLLGGDRDAPQLLADLADRLGDERHGMRRPPASGSDRSTAWRAMSAMIVATSRRNTVERRVSASLMNRKSVVKRWVSAAGLSRPTCARSASIRWP